MSIPPLPPGIRDSPRARVANRLHSIAIHLLRRARRVDRATGLGPERLSLLSVLAYGGPRTVTELADAEMVSRPAITRIVKALEELGLVERNRGASDRRQVVVRATSKGRTVMEAGRRRRVERIVEELQSLDHRALAAVDKAARVLESLEK